MLENAPQVVEVGMIVLTGLVARSQVLGDAIGDSLRAGHRRRGSAKPSK
jgi:hypothetical protein